MRHPRSGLMLDYVSYWDSGLRIVDVTDPANPKEVGAFDTPASLATVARITPPLHPPGDWVYQDDEIGVGGTGGVHVLDTHACDGTAYCTPVQVGYWHINVHPLQAAAVNGRGSGSYHGVIQRFFSWDAQASRPNRSKLPSTCRTQTRTWPVTRTASSRVARLGGLFRREWSNRGQRLLARVFHRAAAGLSESPCPEMSSAPATSSLVAVDRSVGAESELNLPTN
jgi:hypothetical protein